MRVRVCVAYHGQLHPACKPGLDALRACKDIQFDIETRHTSVIAMTRNHMINDNNSNLIYQKLTLGYDGYLVVDDDIAFTLQDVLRVIAHDKDACHAPYKLHNTPSLFDCGKFHAMYPGFISERFPSTATGLTRVDWAAAGFAYYRASVFENLEYPWYRHPIIRVKKSAETASEDIGLCLNLRRHGYKIWCDFDVHIDHQLRSGS